ncbi:Cytochrome P450 monooxygenase [Lachnellula hyalina]|uniref:Cytochrome P450 monooxygenase n=1 Tax=Lachnellula hyalina TaxID=1316788 RepID=A0A8H8R8I3_9HELO|nr:Cytochrome P450 monooxygenase [Lachnellula hyalina]TVY28744.1 Cytochrome P450 monooxygenase [Lachnellula hyalina]
MHFSPQVLAVSFCIFLVVSSVRLAFLRFCSRQGIPDTIPWAGVHEGRYTWLSRARATLQSLGGSRTLLDEAYEKYSKNGLPFVLPNIFTGPELILPQSEMGWLIQQSDEVLDQNEVNRDFLQADHTMLHPMVISDAVHGDVIKNELNRRLGGFTEAVNDELDFAMRKSFGVDTEKWNEIVVYDVMSEIITRISNRVLVGSELCRDEEYLYNSSRFNRWVVLLAACISLFPQCLKRIVGQIVTYSNYQLYLNMTKFILPIWKRQTSLCSEASPKENNYVQWSLDHAKTEAERGSDMITKRLAALSFAAIQSSVVTSANLLFDLAASPLTPMYLQTARDDVSTHLEAEHGRWTKAALSRMLTLDSILRESMRLWGFVSRGVLKTVIVKKGIYLPDGTHIPCRTKIGIHAYPLHHDADYYPNPTEFDGLRFCKPPTNKDGTSDSHPENMLGKEKGIPLVTTSATFMGFSHGKHACPGRFFASQQLKLVLAYIALNYDIKPIERRPDNNWFVGSQAPPLGDKISIRRRHGTV